MPSNDPTAGFAEALLASPLGATVIHRSMVEGLPATLNDLLARTLTCQWDTGPWSAGAPAVVARAYQALANRPDWAAETAEAIAHRFAPALHSRPSLHQELWDLRPPHVDALQDPPPGAFVHTYCCGEFPWAGVPSTSPVASASVARAMADLWEIHADPIPRHSVDVDVDARVWVVHRPEQWAALVARHPMDVTGRHQAWELPGPRQQTMVRDGALDALLAVEGQRAACLPPTRVAMPDWTAVADRWDGVHLSWAGVLTAEGTVTALPTIGDDDGNDNDDRDASPTVTMVRYWGAERTRWLRPVLGPAELLPPLRRRPL